MNAMQQTTLGTIPTKWLALLLTRVIGGLLFMQEVRMAGPWKSKLKTGDYNGNMNAQMYQKYFQELCTSLPHPSRIHMDNASPDF